MKWRTLDGFASWSRFRPFPRFRGHFAPKKKISGQLVDEEPCGIAVLGYC